MRRVLLLLAAVALVAVVVIGLTQAGGERGEAAPARKFSLADAQRRLAGAPAPLAALHRQANELLPGGKGAFAARLRRLKGHPVVINKWASWCGPCQAEFSVFQQVATERGKTVAFVGVDGHDERPAAQRFLRRHPLPYPSYEDHDEAIARFVEAPANYPITVFRDARGRTAFIHQGLYASPAALRTDLRRYLGA
jgi:cytochrome c biogenesis protein CcmG, thiol:disulfide interchange protein DsbE